jgi:hypothetical protein
MNSCLLSLQCRWQKGKSNQFNEQGEYKSQYAWASLMNCWFQVRSLHENCEEFEIVEKHLRDTVPHRELAMVIEIACRCISLTPQERPRMDKIAQCLERLIELDSPPSDFTMSTTASIRTRSMTNLTDVGRPSHDFLDISDLPGFRHDGQKFVIDMGQNSSP